MLTPRSFTFFANRGELSIAGSDIFLQMIRTAEEMAQAYVRPRTLRLTLPPISLDGSEDFDVDVALAARWYARAQEVGFRWINQPLHFSADGVVEPEKIQILSEILSKHQGMFSSVNVKSVAAIPQASSVYARICKSLSRRDFRGFANFRLGVGYNMPDYTPFFPFSDGSETAVSVGLESLPLFRRTWAKTRDFAAIEAALVDELRRAEASFIQVLGEDGPIVYRGADWSLAPLPNGDETVVGLVERISGNPIGSGGNLDTIAKLTGCLKSPVARGVTGTGFNGVMLSVLEDDVLANRFRHRAVTVNDLLLYSSVCGCGLDMVPVAGDTPEVAIAQYATDTGALAYRLKKPLGVRFLPIAPLKAGQETTFSHDFVCNSAVVSL